MPKQRRSSLAIDFACSPVDRLGCLGADVHRKATVFISFRNVHPTLEGMPKQALSEGNFASGIPVQARLDSGFTVAPVPPITHERGS